MDKGLSVSLMSAHTRHCRLWQVLPLQFRVKEGSQIVALHHPIPLPHIWCQKVLEWDCRLGLIWRVPAGMPTITIWCSKMVVTAEGENC